MRELPLEELPVVGALDVDRTAEGIVYRRLPGWTRPQLVDPGLAFLVTMPAGVRWEFTTDARELEVDVLVTAIRVKELPFQPPAFDLVAGGDLLRSVIVEAPQRRRLPAHGRTLPCPRLRVGRLRRGALA